MTRRSHTPPHAIRHTDPADVARACETGIATRNAARRASADAALSGYALGYRDGDSPACTDPGDGAPWIASPRQRRADTIARLDAAPDSRAGHVPTTRDAIPHRDDGRPIVTGEPRTLPVPPRPETRTRALPASVRAQVESAAVAAAHDALAGAPVAALVARAARGARLAAVRGEPAPAGGLLDRAAAVVGAGEWSALDGAPATADRVTRALRTDGALATRYALAPHVTGALPVARMRATGTRCAAPTTGAPRPAADALAGMLDARRGAACADLRTEIRTYHRARAARSATGPVRARIVAMLDAWRDDPAVLEVARAEGWQVK